MQEPPFDKLALAQAILEIVPLIARTIDSTLRGGASSVPIAPPHIGLLKLLSERALTQSELAQMQRVVPSTMSATIDVLQRRGWVERAAVPGDRRATQIQITPEGMDVLIETERRAIDLVETLLDGISEAEQRQLWDGVQVMRRLFEGFTREAGLPPFPFGAMPFPPGFPPPGFPLPPGMPLPPGFPPPPDVLIPAPPGAPPMLWIYGDTPPVPPEPPTRRPTGETPPADKEDHEDDRPETV